MASESYSVLLGNLADAVKRWAYNPANDTYERTFSENGFNRIVSPCHRNIVMKLGADRRGYLAQLIDAAVNKVKETHSLFYEQCTELIRVQRRTNIQIDIAKELFPPDARPEYTKLRIALQECDELFAAIDREIRHHDSSDNKKGNVYENRFEPLGYLPKDLRRKLDDISDSTLKEYAKKSGSRRPGKGKRNFRYQLADCELVCLYIVRHVPDTGTVEAAKIMLLEIAGETEIKSKARN